MEEPPTSPLSPTRLAIYHQNHCEWYLHQAFHRSAPAPAQEAATAPSGDPREAATPVITTAHFQRGIEWEARLFDHLERQGQLLRLPPQTITQERIRDIIIESVSEKNICYISNVVFQSPSFEEELAEFGSNPVPHRLFGVAKPDLIQVNRLETGEIIWEVIDAKSSSSVKTPHHAQIGFYHLALEKLLAPIKSRPGGPTLVPSEFASIWLSPPDGDNPDSPGPVPTPLFLLLPPLRTFLFKSLPKILSLPPYRVQWLLNPLCRGCEFEERCTATTKAEKRLGGIPNLSISEAHFIREVMDITKSQEKKSELEDLEDIIGGPRLTRINESYANTGKKFQRLLDVRVVDGKPQSSLLEAAISGRAKLIQRRVLTFPRSEDISIFLSIVVDVAKNTLARFCASSFAPVDPFAAPIVGSAREFVPGISALLRRIQTDAPAARTQIYTYSSPERGAIISHLISAAVSGTYSSDDIRLCLGTLCEGASLLLTDYQPLILSGVLLSFLSKKNGLKLRQLKTCCKRLQLDDTGTAEVLRARIEAEQKRLAGAAESAESAPRRREVGQLGKVVVLKQEIQRLIALPIPGYIDLPQTAEALLHGANIRCASDDELFAAWSTHDEAKLKRDLAARNRCMRALVRNVRDRIAASGPVEKLLLNEAKPLEDGMVALCHEKTLGKLLLMLQFEAVVRLQELWDNRLEGCPNAPLLRYSRSQKLENGKWQHLFDIASGTLEPRLDDHSYYDWILVPEMGETAPNDEEFTPEIFFDDLLLSSLVFPLTRWTKGKWDQQHPLIREKCFVANVAEIQVVSHVHDSIDPKDEPISQAIVQTYGTYGNLLKKGSLYRISPRLVDFNLTRTLLNLVTLDFLQDTEVEVPFILLITDPQIFAISPSFGGKKALDAEARINQRFNELASLGVSHAAALTLKSSQRKAARRMIGSRLSVIWGPPGTGKTYTLTLSVLRLLEALHMTNTSEKCRTVLVTAMTHAAIDCLIDKLHTLTGHYRAMEDLETTWLASVVVERVRSGTDHSHVKGDDGKIYIYAGTTYQLYKYCEKNGITADIVMIDEAGQLGLGTAALVIRFLSDNGKLVLAGDHEQLAPILSASYPEMESPGPECPEWEEARPLFGSILDTLMSNRPELRRARLGTGRKRADSTDSQVTEESDGTVVQLLENWRLNADLGEFVELIYSRRFRPMKSHAGHIARDLRLWLDSTVSNDMVEEQARRFLVSLADAMDANSSRPTVLQPPRVPLVAQIAKAGGSRPISLALIRTRFPVPHLPYEHHVKAEARLAAALVRLLRKTFGVDESIFVATPHRIQRAAVRQALTLTRQIAAQRPAPGSEEDKIDDLTDKMAGLKVPNNDNLRVDTVERLQGAEASFVIFLLSHTHTQSLADHIGFLLTRRRLNVGISRAKSLCIVISSRGVLNPGIEALANADTRKGLEYLKAYEDRAWSGDIDLNV